MCRKLCYFIWGIWWFHRSKHFDAMKAGKSAIRPWLSCPYNKHMLVNLPSSVPKASVFHRWIFGFGQMWKMQLWSIWNPTNGFCHFFMVDSCCWASCGFSNMVAEKFCLASLRLQGIVRSTLLKECTFSTPL